MSKRWYQRSENFLGILITVLVFAWVLAIVLNVAEEFAKTDQSDKCVSRELVPIETQDDSIVCLKPEYLESP